MLINLYVSCATRSTSKGYLEGQLNAYSICTIDARWSDLDSSVFFSTE